MRKNQRIPAYLPTEDEIRQCCLEIQSGWSKAERKKRSVWYRESSRGETKLVQGLRLGDPFTIPEVQTPSDFY